jgi:hypothetical protein
MPLNHRLPLALLVATVLAGCAFDAPSPPMPAAAPTGIPAPTSAPSPVAERVFPETGHRLRGAFLEFWQQNDGARAFGPPQSDQLWLDGHAVQFFERGRMQAGQPGQPADRVRGAALAAGWQAALPSDMLALPAASQRANLSAPARAEPLAPFEVTLAAPGYSGPAELRLYDSRMRPAGAWTAQLAEGVGSVTVEARGALGDHPAILLIDGRIAGASSRLFALDAQTSIQTGQPRFDQLYGKVRAFMQQDVTTYDLDGIPVHGYRSPDNNLLWLRDHVYQGRAFRYFERDMTSLLDAFRRAQRPDGSFPDYLARPEFGVPAQRMEAEADVEYLFVQGVYEAWQASGDDAWLSENLEAMRRALSYTMSDPLRWDAAHQLVKRPFTIDTWDFQYGPTTIDPTTGRPAARHWIDEQTVWGIFHGDNTGLAYALELLARVEEHLGDERAAERYRADADALMERLNALSWNGSFFTHQVHLTPLTIEGVDEARQLSLSNALALNRRVLSREQGRAIVDEYFQRGQARGQAFAEWYSIDPPFPPGAFGLSGNPGEQPGEYVNGGIMPLVGGELARGAFRYGAERYGFETLTRYFQLIDLSGASYLWYYPAGNPGKSSVDTLPTDGWGASAMVGALIEGAAGVEDRGGLYQDVTLSPRWSYADGVTSARVIARYAASDGYIAYRWRREPQRLILGFSGSGERVRVRLLLPADQKPAVRVLLDGTPYPSEIEDVFGSRYLKLDVPRGSAAIEVTW